MDNINIAESDWTNERSMIKKKNIHEHTKMKFWSVTWWIARADCCAPHSEIMRVTQCFLENCELPVQPRFHQSHQRWELALDVQVWISLDSFEFILILLTGIELANLMRNAFRWPPPRWHHMSMLQRGRRLGVASLCFHIPQKSQFKWAKSLHIPFRDQWNVWPIP